MAKISKNANLSDGASICLNFEKSAQLNRQNNSERPKRKKNTNILIFYSCEDRC
jgi:hypothetical protein